LARLPAGIRPLHDGLQPLQSLEPTRCLDRYFLRSDWLDRPDRNDVDRRDTHQSPPFGGRCKRGDFEQAVGRSRGGRTTKIHALTEDRGRPVAFLITPGNCHDLVGARDLLPTLPPSKRLLADRAYDATSLRDWLAERGTKAVIPPNPTRKHPHRYDAKAYKGRNLIERMFCRLKDFRRIATRYDKRADVYLSAILLAAALTWWTN
jgi:transposase